MDDKPWGTPTISGADRGKELLEENRSSAQVPKETQESTLLMEVETLSFKKKGVQGDGARNVYWIGQGGDLWRFQWEQFSEGSKTWAGGGG